MFYTRIARNEVERERFGSMQRDMNALAAVDLRAEWSKSRSEEVARLMHEHLYRIGHPLVRNPKGAGNG